MGFTVSEKSTCPRCTDALNITISGKFHFLQNLRFNVCTTMTLLSMGAGWFYNQSPIYAYLQKAALTLRLILEALPIPSRRHRLRVWVMYLSIKVLLRRSPGWVSVFFPQNFDHFDFELTFKIMILGVVILNLDANFLILLLSPNAFCQSWKNFNIYLKCLLDCISPSFVNIITHLSLHYYPDHHLYHHHHPCLSCWIWLSLYQEFSSWN